MQNSKSCEGKNIYTSSQLGFSAAMDTIIIENSDNTRTNSPFFVVFGSDKLKKCYKKIINIFINNIQTEILLELNAQGEGKLIDYWILEETKTAKVESYTVTEIQENKTVKLTKTRIINDERIESTQRFQADTQLSESDYHLKLKNNQLSSEQLAKLSLEKGVNIVHYVLKDNPSIYLSGKIYLWDYKSKIVITDIDGTLTKSDILGHLFYYVGKDWTKGGAAYFLNILNQRGYKIIYLSARSLAQLQSTRTYLENVMQDGRKLPDGPLLLNPCNLWQSFISEISKKSKQFKEKMLRNVLDLFSENCRPFFAGIGNRAGDAIAYERVGVPVNYIFIINKKNKEKGEFVSIKNFKDPILRIDWFFPVISNA